MSNSFNMMAPAAVYRQRRARLAKELKRPLVLFSGLARARNYQGNCHPVRASIPDPYFAGAPLEGAALGRQETGPVTGAGAKAEGFLEGVLVVSIEQAVAAPLTTCRLADAGARVIKVERPGGDFARQYDTAANGESAFFVWLNRGKESLEVDFRQPEGEALLHRIIAHADVLVQNLAPGAAERAGFGAEAMRRRHPRLITCSISGYGEEGPYREMRAYDMLVQAESGLASITGTPEAPGRIGVSACDIGTGLNALSAILQALYARTRTGEGAALSVSMFDSMADWMAVPLLLHDLTGQTMARTGLSHPLIAPYGAFPVAGGGSLLISIQNEREWRRVCEGVLERPRMTGHPGFRSSVERLAHRVPPAPGSVARRP